MSKLLVFGWLLFLGSLAFAGTVGVLTGRLTGWPPILGRPPSADSVVPGAPSKAAATPSTMLVGNTDGIGVALRRLPGTEDRMKAWPDGTRLVVLGEERRTSGRVWKKVRDPEGNEGWVAAEYLVTPPTTPPAR
jgi:hypothetical protein